MSGSQAERDLVNALDANGWATMRAPASGGGTKRDMPDVLIGRRVQSPTPGRVSECYAIELKATAGTCGYVAKEEVQALERFSETFGALPRLAVKFKGSGTRTRFWFVPPENCRMTDSGTYGLPQSDIEDRATLCVQPATETKDARVIERP